MDNIKDRFESHFIKVEDCWIWKLYCHPYGEFSFKGKRRQCHRFSYELYKEKIPKGLHIDHMCRQKRCVNPAHLRAVTPRINAIENSDSISAINIRKTHCPKGHEYNQGNIILCNKNGKGRQCRTCYLDYQKRHRKEKRDLKLSLCGKHI